MLPIDYGVDRSRVESILLSAARAHAVVDEPRARAALAHARSRYALADASLESAVFCRITENWLEMSLRFLVPSRGEREIKDAISRDLWDELNAAGIGLASTTYNIVGLPAIEITATRRDGAAP